MGTDTKKTIANDIYKTVEVKTPEGQDYRPSRPSLDMQPGQVGIALAW